MADTPLDTLTTPLSQTDIETIIVEALDNPGTWMGQILPPFLGTSWGPTSMGPYFTMTESNVLAILSQKQASIGKGGYLFLSADPSLVDSTGTSPWTTLIAQQQFNLPREPATTTIGIVTATAAAGASGTITPNSTTITDGQGNYFVANTGGSIPTGSTLVFTVHCTAPGSQGNLTASQPVSLVTAIPGVTVNLGVGSFPASTWITTPGTDVESDASLIARCINQWTTLATGSPQGAIENWCYAACPQVRFAIVSATGLGGIVVTVYSNNAPVSSDGLSQISAFITPRLPLGSFLAPGSPQNALGLELDMTAQLYGPASAQASALAAATTAISTLIRSTPVGGFPISASSTQYGISNAQIVDAIMNSSSALTKAAVYVNSVANADFIMTPQSGVPVVATSPAGSNPYGLVYNTI